MMMETRFCCETGDVKYCGLLFLFLKFLRQSWSYARTKKLRAVHEIYNILL